MSSGPGGPAIDVRGISKHFTVAVSLFRRERVHALRGIDLSVQPGEAFGLVGSNGSGKSTLLRILSTVLIPSAGRAWVKGVPIAQVCAVKRLVGVVPSESRGFSGECSGRQNLELFSVLQRLEPAAVRGRVEYLLERMGIANLGPRPVWTYSTGQRQRLNIARALLHDPPVCLLDEPGRGLDPWVARELRCWIKEELVERQGKTVLMASHQMEEISEICSRAALLRDGKIAWVGPPEQIKDFLR